MFEQFALGVFYPVDSMLHRLRARTKLLALVHVSNALGTKNPVREVVAKVRAAGVPVLLINAKRLAWQMGTESQFSAG